MSNVYNSIVYVNQQNTSAPRSIICKEKFLTLASVVFTPKGYFLLDALNEKITNLKSAGLVEHWHSKAFDKDILKMKESKQPKVIKMQHLLGCFRTWMFGLLFSIFAFIVELLWKAKLVLLTKLFGKCKNHATPIPGPIKA